MDALTLICYEVTDKLYLEWLESKKKNRSELSRVANDGQVMSNHLCKQCFRKAG